MPSPLPEALWARAGCHRGGRSSEADDARAFALVRYLASHPKVRLVLLDHAEAQSLVQRTRRVHAQYRKLDRHAVCCRTRDQGADQRRTDAAPLPLRRDADVVQVPVPRLAFAVDIGFDKVYAASVLGMGSLLTVGGIIGIGAISDFIGREISAIVAYLISIIGVICALSISSPEQYGLLWLHACFFGLT